MHMASALSISWQVGSHVAARDLMICECRGHMKGKITASLHESHKPQVARQRRSSRGGSISSTKCNTLCTDKPCSSNGVQSATQGILWQSYVSIGAPVLPMTARDIAPSCLQMSIESPVVALTSRFSTSLCTQSFMHCTAQTWKRVRAYIEPLTGMLSEC